MNEAYQMSNLEHNAFIEHCKETEIYINAEIIIDGKNIIIEAELFSLDGSKRFYEKKIEKVEKFREIGKEIGQILKIKSNNSYKR